MQTTQFTCKRDGLTIRGEMFLPENSQMGASIPAIILSHGFTGNYSEMEGYAVELVKMGYAAFCFNFCGGGSIYDDAMTKSDGTSINMNISTEVEDLCAVLDYVKSLSYIDTKQITLLGISQGGMVSGITAARRRNDIAKLVMIYPALCIPDHARRGCLGGASYDANNVPEVMDLGRTVISREFHEDVVHMDVYNELSAYKGPVLILQGLEDNIVNYSYAIRAKENYKEDQCRLQLIENMGHGPNKEQQAGLVASVRQFLNNRREILTIRVLITRVEESSENQNKIMNIFFNGYCDTPYFHGVIVPEGCDHQEHIVGEKPRIRAEYTLSGLDEAKQNCKIHVVNQWGTIDWKPVIDTDSQKLEWLNGADLTAVLEYGTLGPVVRIFVEDKLCTKDC